MRSDVVANKRRARARRGDAKQSLEPAVGKVRLIRGYFVVLSLLREGRVNRTGRIDADRRGGSKAQRAPTLLETR